MKDGLATLTIELPGVPKHLLELSVSDNVISVTGKRPPTEAKDFAGVSPAKFHEAPEPSGAKEEKSTESIELAAEEGITYSAKFKLAYVVDVEGIKAEFKDGLLRMIVPTKKKSENRRLLLE